MFVNSLEGTVHIATQAQLLLTLLQRSDFCLWGPPVPNSSVGNTEGEMVAWCTKAGHGTRVMPEGTLLAVQLLKAPDYVQITGLIDQTKINIAAGDYGGELDPHGQDLVCHGTRFSTHTSQPVLPA